MSNVDANFDDIKQRLDEIADRVSQEGIDLDEALSLYEEAVKLGIAACDVSEIDAEVEQAEGDAAGEADGASADATYDASADASAPNGGPVVEAAEAEVAEAVEAPTQEEEL